MLEFIVLGQIPFTNTQISFGLVLVIILLVGIGSIVYLEVGKVRSNKRTKASEQLAL